MKPHRFRAYRSNQAGVRGWPAIGSDEASHRLYWTLTPDLLFLVRPWYRRRFLYEAINPAFETALGIPTERIREMAVSDCMGKEYTSALHEIFNTCVSERTEVRVQHRFAFGGERRNLETIVTPICDPGTGNVTMLIGNHRRVPDRLGAVEPAPSADAKMNLRLVSLQEDIQQRIASDLHDSTCQHLIAASLSLMRVRASLEDAAAAARLCDDIDASIDQALREIRAFAYLLHPRDLTVDGLKATIEQYARGFAVRTSLKVTTEISSDVDRLPYRKQRSLLRVIQEALTNVFRHAKATKVQIAVEATDSHFLLRVMDNGRGMPIGRTGCGNRGLGLGVGIPAMRVRLQQLGGTLEIQSTANAQRPGTTLRAVFPHHLPSKHHDRRKSLAINQEVTLTPGS